MGIPTLHGRCTPWIVASELEGGLVQGFHRTTRRGEWDLIMIFVTSTASMEQTPMEFIDGVGGPV